MVVHVNFSVNVSIPTRVNAMNAGSVIECLWDRIEMCRISAGSRSFELCLSKEQHGNSEGAREETKEDQTEIIHGIAERLVSTIWEESSISSVRSRDSNESDDHLAAVTTTLQVNDFFKDSLRSMSFPLHDDYSSKESKRYAISIPLYLHD